VHFVELHTCDWGWSLSNEAAHRLEQSFTLPEVVELLFEKYLRTWEALQKQGGGKK